MTVKKTVPTSQKPVTAADLLKEKAAPKTKKAAPKTKKAAPKTKKAAPKKGKSVKNAMTIVKPKGQKNKVTIIKSKAPTLAQFKKMVDGVLIAGRRTIDLSFKLGEALIQKKKELGHGSFLPFLLKIDIPARTANKLMQAFRAKDTHKVGQTFSSLIGDDKSADSADSGEVKEPKEAKSPEPISITNLDQLSKATKSTLIMAIVALKKAVAGQLTEEGKARLLSPEQFDAVVFNNVND